MQHLRILFLLLLIQSCQNNHSSVKAISRVDSFRNSLIGKWGGLNESEPVWRISHDSIYNYEQNKSYPYEIIGNDLVFDNGLSKPNLKDITVINDTLFYHMKASLDKEIYITVRGFRYR